MVQPDPDSFGSEERKNSHSESQTTAIKIGVNVLSVTDLTYCQAIPDVYPEEPPIHLWQSDRCQIMWIYSHGKNY